MKVKALSLHQPYASLICCGKKTIETRRWPTSYFGDLLICSTKTPIIEGGPYLYGYALCVVEVVACRMMLRGDEEAACCTIYHGAYAWMLKNIRPLTKPFGVRGNRKIFEIDVDPAQLESS